MQQSITSQQSKQLHSMLDRALDALQNGSPTNIGADTVLKDSLSPNRILHDSNSKMGMEINDLNSNADMQAVFFSANLTNLDKEISELKAIPYVKSMERESLDFQESKNSFELLKSNMEPLSLSGSHKLWE